MAIYKCPVPSADLISANGLVKPTRLLNPFEAEDKIIGQCESLCRCRRRRVNRSSISIGTIRKRQSSKSIVTRDEAVPAANVKGEAIKRLTGVPSVNLTSAVKSFHSTLDGRYFDAPYDACEVTCTLVEHDDSSASSFEREMFT